MSTRAPSLGRGCRAQRGGVGFLFLRRSRLLFAFPLGEGEPRSGARVLSYIVDLRRLPPLSFIPLVPYPPLRGTFPSRGRLCIGDTAFPIQPPPLRGTSFHRKEGVTTRAPSLGRGCRAQRGGVGFLFCGKAASSLPSPLSNAIKLRKMLAP